MRTLALSRTRAYANPQRRLQHTFRQLASAVLIAFACVGAGIRLACILHAKAACAHVALGARSYPIAPGAWRARSANKRLVFAIRAVLALPIVHARLPLHEANLRQARQRAGMSFADAGTHVTTNGRVAAIGREHSGARQNRSAGTVEIGLRHHLAGISKRKPHHAKCNIHRSHNSEL